MDPELYRAAQSGNWDKIKGFANSFSSEKTPTGNTILHVLAQSYDSSDVAAQILGTERNLALRGNKIRETPLHIAARRGHCNVIQELIESTKKTERLEELLGSKNKNGNTALHEAVRSNCLGAVKLLVEADHEFLVGKNKNDESPLYLAADNGNSEIVELILSTCEYLSFCGPRRRTALHVAAARNFTGCIELILEKLPSLKKMDDESGWTALHYAAKFNHKEVVKLLLTKENSMGYLSAQGDGQKIALHVAVIHGNVDVVEEILSFCPDCWEMVTEKFHNILHLAVKYEQEDVLKSILGNPWASELINQKDIDGNTPLHLYVATNRLGGYDLVIHPGVERNVYNSAGLTPLDMIPKEADKFSERQASIKDQLVKAGATPGIGGVDKSDTGSGETVIGNVRTTENEANNGSGEVAKLDTYMLIATLIITVTFAAGFTVPGGYSNSNGNEGMAVLSKKAAFTAFVVSDSSALIFSIISVLSLFGAKDLMRWLPLPESRRSIKIYITFAMTSMVMAFVTGLYAVLPVGAMAIYLLVAGCLLCFIIPAYFLYLKGVKYAYTALQEKRRRTSPERIRLTNDRKDSIIPI